MTDLTPNQALQAALVREWDRRLGGNINQDHARNIIVVIGDTKAEVEDLPIDQQQ